MAVVLDPDVASVFASSDTVNTFLRSVITAMPEARQRRVKAGYYNSRMEPPGITGRASPTACGPAAHAPMRWAGPIKEAPMN